MEICDFFLESLPSCVHLRYAIESWITWPMMPGEKRGTNFLSTRFMRRVSMAQTKPEAPRDVAHSREGLDPVPAGVSKAANGFEWKTRTRILGLPLICIAFGADKRGRPRVARGFIALGQFAVGIVVIAQFGLGFISLGQVAVGVAAGGQLAVGMLTGMGQVCVGTFAVGQVVLGVYGRGQVGWADYLWSPSRTDMEAVAMFETIDWLVQQDMGTIWDSIQFELEMGLKSLASPFR
jgi:hypothetical protein